MQRSLFPDGPLNAHFHGCEFRLERTFLEIEQADSLLSNLSALPGWRQDEIRMYGNSIPLPRLHRWFADDEQTYRWSGINMQAEKFPTQLLSVREKIVERTGLEFNTALANLYRSGQDSVAWHADDEPELGSHPIIFSLSLGGTRRFVLRHKQNHQEKIAFDLSHGSLLMMCKNTQRICEHCVPKQRTAAPRINVTFRLIRPLRPVL